MTIRKTGHMNNARSHVQGLLPYVLPDGKCHFPEKTDTDGNFGQYVCDFGLVMDEDEEGGDYGREISISGYVKDFDENKRYKRFRYLDLARAYHYAKKQIRDGIVVKQVTRDIVTGKDCEGNPIKEAKKVWTDKLDIGETIEPYEYVPINYYGLDSDGHRTVANFAQDGNYGFIFVNQSGNEPEPSIENGQYGLIVGVYRNDGIIYPNQDKKYGRDENDEVYWEYPDTAGKIKDDCDRWKEFGFSVNDDDYWAVCKDMETQFIGYLDIPQDIEGDSVPDRISYSDIKEWLDWFDKHPKDSCCYEKTKGEDGVTNMEDKEWTAHGGDKMRDFLKGKESLIDDAINNIKGLVGGNKAYLVPNMEFPLLLTEEYRDTGLWTEYEDEEWSPHAKKDAKTIESNWWEADLENEDEAPLYIESQLQLVRSEVYHSDDNGSLPGLFAVDGGYYKCRYRNYWEYQEYGGYLTEEEKEELPGYTDVPASASTRFDDDIIRVGEYDEEGTTYHKQVNLSYIEVFSINPPKDCYDDYRAANNSECYYAATVVEEAVPILCTLTQSLTGRGPLPITNEGTLVKTFSASLASGNLLYDGEYIQLLAKYKSPLTIPYIEWDVHNFYKGENGDCFGDYVTDIKIDNGTIVITYQIGGECTEDGMPDKNSKYGILLQDTYNYEAEHTYTCQFEDYPTDIKGEYIDFDNSPNAITVENSDLGSMQADDDGNMVFTPRTRQCNQARIIGLRTGDALHGTGEGILFKTPENDGLQFPSKTDVDIELNRGAAAAFESYFKLSECNTMQDLENYQNNWFNI